MRKKVGEILPRCTCCENGDSMQPSLNDFCHLLSYLNACIDSCLTTLNSSFVIIGVNIQNTEIVLSKGRRYLIQRLFMGQPHYRSAQVWHALSMDYTVFSATTRLFTNGMNHTYICLPCPKMVLIYRPRRDGRLSWWVNSLRRTATWRLSQLSAVQTVTPHWATGAQENVELELVASRTASHDANHWVTLVLYSSLANLFDKKRSWVGWIKSGLITVSLWSAAWQGNYKEERK